MVTRRPRVPRASRPAGATESQSPADAEKPEVVQGIAKPIGGPRSSAAREVASGVRSKLGAAQSNARSAAQTVKRQVVKQIPLDQQPVKKPVVKQQLAKQPGSRKALVATKTASVPARSFSGRLIALLVVFAVIAVLLAPSVNTYLQQRSNIASLKTDIATAQQQQNDLKGQISRWNDPAYVKQQARDRVNMMMPGETGYWVYGGSSTPATPDKAGTGSKPDSLPWVDGLWQSIIRSGTE